MLLKPYHPTLHRFDYGLASTPKSDPPPAHRQNLRRDRLSRCSGLPIVGVHVRGILQKMISRRVCALLRLHTTHRRRLPVFSPQESSLGALRRVYGCSGGQAGEEQGDVLRERGACPAAMPAFMLAGCILWAASPGVLLTRATGATAAHLTSPGPVRAPER
ncbi:hypothetical protein AcW1_007578 [Taiwanofungus camphoratus]|nr:hypothetical protein AcW1_007578 [Antrodia cinnamomea]